MIYSQSFFFSALREDSSKSNSRALRERSSIPICHLLSFLTESHFVLVHDHFLAFLLVFLYICHYER